MATFNRRLAALAATVALLLPLSSAPAWSASASAGSSCKARLTTAVSGKVHLYCGTNPKAAARATTPLVWRADATCYTSISSYSATRASVTTSLAQLAELKRKIASLPKDKQAAPTAQLKAITASLQALSATLNKTRTKLLASCG